MCTGINIVIAIYFWKKNLLYLAYVTFNTDRSFFYVHLDNVNFLTLFFLLNIVKSQSLYLINLTLRGAQEKWSPNIFVPYLWWSEQGFRCLKQMTWTTLKKMAPMVLAVSVLTFWRHLRKAASQSQWDLKDTRYTLVLVSSIPNNEITRSSITIKIRIQMQDEPQICNSLRFDILEQKYKVKVLWNIISE